MDIKKEIEAAVYAQDYLPLTAEQWAVHFDEVPPEKVIKIISAMEREFLVVLSKKGKVLPITDSDLRRGVFRSTGRGFGYVDVTDKIGQVQTFFIPAQNRNHAMHEDVVLIRILRLPKSNTDGEAKVQQILEHTVRQMVGVVSKKRVGSRHKPTTWRFTPDDKRLSCPIEIVQKRSVPFHDNDKVLVEILHYPTGNVAMSVRVAKVFGSSASTDAHYDAILYAHHIPTEFPKPVLEECDRKALRPLVLEGRTDLRYDDRYGVIFTMDGADAKDLDDAVSLCRTQSGNYLLGVHVADVSEYVSPQSVTDVEAFARGCSVYFVDQVVPMLPRSLSNGACSLNADQDRYALSCFMEIGKDGTLLSCRVEQSVIRCCVRGVYSEINDVIENGTASAFFAKYEKIQSVLPLFCELHDLLLQKRRAAGMLELVSEEAKIQLDEKGYPVEIQKRELGLAEQIIEQCMLCANEAVASICQEKDVACVYRVHAAPPQEKLEAFLIYANQCGLSLDHVSTDPNALTPLQLRSVLEQAKERGIGAPISQVLLRSLSKAAYSHIPALHFGLAMMPYCHFTSPIRRYPDLCVHRYLKAFLFGKWDTATKKRFAAAAQSSAVQSSENELRALYAERDIEDLYKMLYLQSKIGQTFPAQVSGLTSFGVFVQLENTCEGMIPFSSLEEYAIFDQRTLSVRIGRQTLHLCDPIMVKLLDVDMDARRATFAIALP